DGGGAGHHHGRVAAGHAAAGDEPLGLEPPQQDQLQQHLDELSQKPGQQGAVDDGVGGEHTKTHGHFLLSARWSAKFSRKPLSGRSASAALALAVSSATRAWQASSPSRSTKVRLPSARSEPMGLPSSPWSATTSSTSSRTWKARPMWQP